MTNSDPVVKIDHNAAMRERSGNVNIHSKLVSFLYTLLRDRVSPADVEKMVRDSQEPDVHYTNGWLALYAQDVAKRLETEVPR